MNSIDSDTRYTADKLQAMSLDEIAAHLVERQAQLDRAAALHREAHEAYAALDDVDTPEGRELMANISSYCGEAAVQRRIVRQLETRRELDRQANPLLIPTAALDYLSDELSDNGLPGFEPELEANHDVTQAMWLHAQLGYESHTDRRPTNRQTADRVAAAWLTLYTDPDSVELTLSQHQAQRIHDLLTTLRDLDDGENVSSEEIEELCRVLNTAAGDTL